MLFNSRGMKMAMKYLPAVIVIIAIMITFVYMFYPNRMDDIVVGTTQSLISTLLLSIVLILIFGGRK